MKRSRGGAFYFAPESARGSHANGYLRDPTQLFPLSLYCETPYVAINNAAIRFVINTGKLPSVRSLGNSKSGQVERLLRRIVNFQIREHTPRLRLRKLDDPEFAWSRLADGRCFRFFIVPPRRKYLPVLPQHFLPLQHRGLAPGANVLAPARIHIVRTSFGQHEPTGTS